MCTAEFHRALCSCPPGLQGNPLVRCVTVGCQQDEDCDPREKCDYGSQRCIPLCTIGACAQGAQCDARNHREFCACVPPLQGDGYSFCERRKDIMDRRPTPCSLCYQPLFVPPQQSLSKILSAALIGTAPRECHVRRNIARICARAGTLAWATWNVLSQTPMMAAGPWHAHVHLALWL